MNIVINEKGNGKIYYADICKITDRGRYIIIQDSDDNIITADKKETESIVIEIDN